MSVLRPMDKLPDLNRATILLVSTEDALLQQLAESVLKIDCATELRVLQKVEESLNHVDSSFFLGKVCFLVTGAGRESHCSVHQNTVMKLAHTYRSPLLFCDLQVESFRAAMAQRLVRVLQVCAGHVPGISALNLLSLLRSPENPPSKEL
ncbi:centromere protein M isoform X1 [Rattus norvegicus]|uniref:centromere protein M isoform X1 n=1 Tax=Rattus norvegicus TaxID=10116 RepID=UPI0004E47F74|nr:centromere protein M isoform X1 [Rattus norvegicus]|eukprot:XP_008763942.1 PREDICTED: centromere protein M isoform X1 [Rattus norvegicus]